MKWNACSPKSRNFHPNDVNSKCKDHRLIMWKTCWNTRTNTWCAETILDVERILWNDLPSQLVELEVCLMNKACTFVQLCFSTLKKRGPSCFLLKKLQFIVLALFTNSYQMLGAVIWDNMSRKDFWCQTSRRHSFHTRVITHGELSTHNENAQNP